MDNIIRRGSECAAFGGIIGGAVGTLLAGTTIVLAGTTVVLAPLAVAAATTISCSAAGTLFGGTAGVAYGANENRKNAKVNERG